MNEQIQARGEDSRKEKDRANGRFWKKNWQAWIGVIKGRDVSRTFKSKDWWHFGFTAELGVKSSILKDLLTLSFFFFFLRDCLKIAHKNLTKIEYEYLPGFRAFFGKWNFFFNYSTNSIVFIIFTYSLATNCFLIYECEINWDMWRIFYFIYLFIFFWEED